VFGKDKERFGAIRDILAKRYAYISSNIPYVYSFYARFYGNISEIDTSKSVWFM
jgi:hypothetical protein